LLNSGEVPNLFEPDELDNIVQKVRPLAKAAGKFDNRVNVIYLKGSHRASNDGLCDLSDIQARAEAATLQTGDAKSC
jgi:hypothetical protein